jgi:uncharacterized protein YjbJ (UPF0337 family)
MANEDLLSRNWSRLRARIREHWHALTAEDVALIDGNRTMLASILCERYGYNEQQAQKEIDEFLDQAPAPAS